jgi:TfoX/Sxy family transcriptional regulator of competence genes
MDKYLIRTIIVIMTSIGQVEYRMHEQFTGIYKDGILFAKVQAEGLYLLNDQSTFIKIDKKEDIKDKLKQAYNVALVSA